MQGIKPETELILKTTYSDGENFKTIVSIGKGDIVIDDLFELFKRVSVGHGFSEETVNEYLDGD